MPWYTFTDDLLYTGYRLALFGSDATGVTTHWMFDTDKRLKVGVYQLYENNVEQDDDVRAVRRSTTSRTWPSTPRSGCRCTTCATTATARAACRSWARG